MYYHIILLVLKDFNLSFVIPVPLYTCPCPCNFKHTQTPHTRTRTHTQAFWEWGNVDKDLWHPFERETNIQIEDMYDSGSQWAELTLCLPSPMPFLLDLHDMKLVNFRTAARWVCVERRGRVPNEHFVYRIRLQLLPKMVSIIEGVCLHVYTVCYSSLLVHALHVQCIS